MTRAVPTGRKRPRDYQRTCLLPPLFSFQVTRAQKKAFNDARVTLQRVAHTVWGSATELWNSERAVLMLAILHRCVHCVFCTLLFSTSLGLVCPKHRRRCASFVSPMPCTPRCSRGTVAAMRNLLPLSFPCPLVQIRCVPAM